MTQQAGPGDRSAELVDWLTRSQGWLYGQILVLLPDREAARDVLQQTNMVIWQKAAEFDPARGFLGWAASIAQFQVRAHLRDRKRNRTRFDDVLVDLLSAEAVSSMPHAEPGEQEAALRRCLMKLASGDRELVLARYQPEGSVKQMAMSFKKTPNAISRSLYRIRRILGACIERQMQGST